MSWKPLSPDRSLRRRAAWAARDLSWAQRLHRAARYRTLVRVLVIVSWVGDGPFWYVLIGALALLGGTHGRDVAMQMLLAGLLNLPLYFWLKHSIGRPRPFEQCPDIRACARALDRFSFPSGHALHAFTFLVICLWYFPLAALALVPLVALIAVSRVALGLHYPSDVLAGAVLGTSVASGVLLLYSAVR
jgi:undecaprenyl-diphosphatase